ncbi:MAG: hypothetical protein JNN15_19205 [Blastocatellia bacterium]|nr:hypothetical protein [Blastocatellia bacterium]
MKKLTVLSLLFWLIAIGSSHAVAQQDSASDVYKRLKDKSVVTTKNSNEEVHYFIAGAKRVDANSVLIDSALVVANVASLDAKADLVMSVQPCVVEMKNEVVFSRQDIGQTNALTTQLTPNMSSEIMTSPKLMVFAPEDANSIEVKVNFRDGEKDFSLTLLLPIQNTFNPSVVSRTISSDCQTWSLTCSGGCSISKKCSNTDVVLNCVNCTITNCTPCKADSGGISIDEPSFDIR